jgi:Papain-like cysteine protease AvrRpt2
MTALNSSHLRHFVSVLLLSAVLLVTAQAANAAHTQLPNGAWRVYLSRQVPIVRQETPVWCWAASLSALFGYFGHPIDQKRIVARYFPPPGITSGPPWVMRDALNTTWVDDQGNSFKVSSPITNLYPPAGPTQVNNVDIIRALDNEIPVFYGDTTHAMVLVQADYFIAPDGTPQIVGGGAVDPYPNPMTGFAFGFRPLQPNEMRALFAAIPSVQ